MIEKLYKLKISQRDQVLMQKSTLESKILSIDAEVMLTENKINITSVNKHGAISDFAILTIHKNTMKLHISNLNKKKFNIEYQRDILQKKIIQLQKESEQFAYILDEEKKLQIKKLLLAEEEASSEYMQSKYIRG